MSIVSSSDLVYKAGVFELEYLEIRMLISTISAASDLQNETKSPSLYRTSVYPFQFQLNPAVPQLLGKL